MRLMNRRFAAGAMVVLMLFLAVLLAPVSGAGGTDPSSLGKLWVYTREDNEATFWKLAWSPDGKYVAATFFDNTLVVLNADDGTVEQEFNFNPEDPYRCDGFAPEGTRPLRCVAFSPKSDLLACAGDDLKVRVINTTTWETELTLAGHTGSVLCLDFSPNGRFLASGSGTDKVIPQNDGENLTRIWDMDKGRQYRVLEGHADGVLGVRWSHGGDRIATCSDDRTVRVWSFPGCEQLLNMTGHTSGVLDLDWTEDDSNLITGSRDYKIKMWDTKTGKTLATWDDNNCVRSVDVHPTAELAATSGVDLTLKIRDLGTGSELKIIKDGIDAHAMVMNSRWSPDGTRLVSGLGKSHQVIMYAFGAQSGQEGGMDVGRSTLSTVALLGVSIVFLAALFYPVMGRIRKRRG